MQTLKTFIRSKSKYAAQVSSNSSAYKAYNKICHFVGLKKASAIVLRFLRKAPT